MRLTRLLLATALGGVLASSVVLAQGPGTKRVRITHQNLTAGQGFAPSVFMSHNAGAPKLYNIGGKASFGLAQLAETGNVGPVAGIAGKMMGKFVGRAVIGLPTMPGGTGQVDLEVSRAHPMVSGAWMLGMTNDGFTGLSGVNAYELTRPRTINAMAMDAGSERNNERRPFLVALMGTRPDPENGSVKRHAGIRGGADAPANWKFDPARPVARITITPL
jgi:hypothetical protein